MLLGYARGLLELHTGAPAFVAEAGDLPLATASARWDADNGGSATSLRHQLVSLKDPVVRAVLRHCDGRHDRAALVSRLEEGVRAGELIVRHQGRRIDSGPELRTYLSTEVERALGTLARSAILIG